MSRSMEDIWARAERLENELEKATKLLQAYEAFESDVERAMQKVGWNNSRIEEAYDTLHDTIRELYKN